MNPVSGIKQSIKSEKKSDVKLRKANLDDMLMVLAWQNAPGARQYCRQPEPIEPEEHSTWFAAKLADENSQMYIITKSGRDVGMLRLDLVDQQQHYYEVSLIVDQKMHGQAIGKSAVEASKKLVQQGAILAEVLPENVVSISLFLDLDFKPYDCHKDGQWFRFKVSH